MGKAFFRIFLYFLCSLTLIPKGYAQHFFYRLYNMNDGLPGTKIYHVLEDKNGYLWINSNEGVSRFDGRQFINYGINDGVPSISSYLSFQDSKLHLWVGTRSGIAQFKNERFISYPTSDNQSNLYVFNITETKEKKVWALTGNGIYEFTGSQWKKITLYPGFENNACRNISEKDGSMYVNYGIAIAYRNKNRHWTLLATNQPYRSLFNKLELYENEIWVSTGVNIFKISNNQLVPLYKKDLISNGYFDYFVDRHHRLWLAGNGYLKVSGAGDWNRLTQVGNQYHYSNIWEDDNSNTWVGTDEGLIELKDVSYTDIIAQSSVRPKDIYNIIALPNSGLLISSNGLMTYANNKFNNISPPLTRTDSNYNKDPVDAYAFEDSTLWLGTRFNKLLSFDGKTLSDHSDLLHVSRNGNIYSMAYIKSRKLLFICADSTLFVGNQSGFSVFIPRNMPLPKGNTTLIHLLPNNILLLFIEGKGAYGIDSANNLFPLNKELKIDDGNLENKKGIFFYDDNAGHFWISFPGFGIEEYGFSKNKTPYLNAHFDVSNGLQSNHVMSMTSDGQNRMWIATNKGIDILQLNKNKEWEIFNFAKTEELGIKQAEFEKLITDRKGDVWFSSPENIFRFNIDSIILTKKPPLVIIEKISLDFKETNWLKLTDSLYSYYQLPWQPVLHYNQNSLGISFNATDLSTASPLPEYSYKLLPFDTAWSIPSKSKFVSLAELPAGKYQFLVKAKDRASGWSNPALFSFTIKPPFWNLWWFKLLVIALTAFIIIRLFMARIARIKKDADLAAQLTELEMKALKAQMNPHFVFNAINSIQALVANDKKNEAIYYIGSFSRLLRQVFDNSENDLISLDKELETVGLYIQLETLRLNMELHYSKNIQDYVITEHEKIPPLLLQPFVENALWHGLSFKEGRKEISISIYIKDQWLLCNITDNGIGRAKALELKEKSTVIHLSKGLEITRRRLIDFNGSSNVSPFVFTDLFDENDKPCGTTVTLHIRRKTSSS